MAGWVERSDTQVSCEGPRWVSLRSTHPTELIAHKADYYRKVKGQV